MPGGRKGDPPAGVFYDPPVVDVFERITGDLLLVRAAPPIFIPEQEVPLLKHELAAF